MLLNAIAGAWDQAEKKIVHLHGIISLLGRL